MKDQKSCCAEMIKFKEWQNSEDARYDICRLAIESLNSNSAGG